MTDNTKDAKTAWQSLDAVMAELKLAHPEYLPLEEGKRLIPPHIWAELESSRFIKRKDKPLVLYALFSSYDYEEEPEKFLKVLKRIGLVKLEKILKSGESFYVSSRSIRVKFPRITERSTIDSWLSFEP